MKTPFYRFLLLVAAVAVTAGVHAADPAASPELDKAHADLRAAWQQTQQAQENLAKIESKLGIDSPRALAWEFMSNPKRGALGLVFTRGRGDAALRVQAVSPGGAAEAAGLKEGDTLLSIDKTSLAGLSADDALETLHRLTRTLEVGTKVKIKYDRAGKTAESTLIAARPPLMLGRRTPDHADGDRPEGGPPRDLLMSGPGSVAAAGAMPDGMPGPMPGAHMDDRHEDAPFQLTGISPDLAPYFKVDSGVLVLSVHPGDGEPPTFGMKAGDVIQSVDGQRVASPSQMFDRLFRAAGTTIKLAGVRAGAPLSLDAAVPTKEVIEAQIMRRHKRPPFAVE